MVHTLHNHLQMFCNWKIPCTPHSAACKPMPLAHMSSLFVSTPLLQLDFSLNKTGPGKVVNVDEEFEFSLTADVQTGKPASLTLTDTPPAGSSIRFLRASLPSCEVSESLLSCVLSSTWPQTVTLTAAGTVAGTFENVALLTGPTYSSTAKASVTVFLPRCGETTPGGTPYDRCPAGYGYDPRFAGKAPSFSNCCVSGDRR